MHNCTVTRNPLEKVCVSDSTAYICIFHECTGAFGKVYKGMLTKPGCSVEQVAIKTIKS